MASLVEATRSTVNARKAALTVVFMRQAASS